MAYLDFVGLANGAAWPSPWLTGGTADVQNERGRLAPGHARYTSVPVNLDFAMRFTFNPTGQIHALHMCSRAVAPESTLPPSTFYGWELRRLGLDSLFDGQTRLIRRVANVDTVLAAGPAVNISAPGGVERVAVFRVRTVGDTVELRVKQWPYGDPEPGWQVTYVDDSADRILTNPSAAIWVTGPATLSVGGAEFTDVAPPVPPPPQVQQQGTDVLISYPAVGTYYVERQPWTGRGRPR